jgi:hypothetical protein
MSDGAHEGILPEDALHTILGRSAPPPEQRLSSPQMQRWIDAATEREDSYNDAPRRAARLVLEHLDAHPDDAALDLSGLYNRIAQTGEGAPLRLLGLSGFQWGWAVNAARYVRGLPPVPNPAILEIREDDVR